eukprot:TRINITY_DN15496_c0_g1_i1.p1 TRINITY_DN15496_c0_g1~~TRINITY_DN15496_c0_g1_i1.p1  ORF type:complete len:428 (-),score=56.12 TRINITY_DN15496_c0_g1_i1:33-1199(-)
MMEETKIRSHRQHSGDELDEVSITVDMDEAGGHQEERMSLVRSGNSNTNTGLASPSTPSLLRNYPESLISAYSTDSSTTSVEDETNSKYAFVPRPTQLVLHCNNRFVSGPDRGYWYFFMGLILFFTITFYVCTVPYLWSHVSVTLVVITVYLTIQVWSNVLVTAYSDPGIIPRKMAPMPPSDKQSIDITVGEVMYQCKFCPTCRLYRPPRSSHCKICNNCVHGFDHHCPVLGNCIGKRNYPTFIKFLLWATIGCLFCAVCGIIHIVRVVGQMEAETTFLKIMASIKIDYPENTLGSWIVAGMCLWTSLSIGGFGGYHVMITAKGHSTNESIKRTYRNAKNPFSEGWFMNLLTVLLPIAKPSVIEPYDEYVNMTMDQVRHIRKENQSPV